MRFLFVFAVLFACTTQEEFTHDLHITNANIYMGNGKELTGSVAIKDGKIAAIGQLEGTAKQTINAGGNFLMPGFIEGHGHFSGLGNTLQNLDLLSTTSWEQVLNAVEQKVQNTEKEIWITGRGWHQEKWSDAPENTVSGYPPHDALSAISPNHPVVLRHASGHALMANAKAMALAGITSETKAPEGGTILKNADGQPIGIFEENAMNLIMNQYQAFQDSFTPEENEATWYQSIELAQDECLKKGITSFQDAGASFWELERYKKMAEEGDLNVRLWSMMSSGARQPLSMENTENFPVLNAGNGFFTCRAIKAYMDGALGSRGAWLIEDYTDMPGYKGQNVTPVEEIERTAEIAVKRGLQLCVHAIGDRGNREVIQAMEKTATEQLNNLRWRIEHAQHLHPEEVSDMAKNNLIASMQAVHCTSDSPFVEKRLGYERAKEGAYIWRTLMDNKIRIANGTDVPVEKIDPLENFYAAVTRQRLDDGSSFFPEQKMTRTEALDIYTLGNAYAAFEEDLKGSIEVGKFADIIILDTNLLTCADGAIPNANILYTIVNGEVKHQLN